MTNKDSQFSEILDELKRLRDQQEKVSQEIVALQDKVHQLGYSQLQDDQESIKDEVVPEIEKPKELEKSDSIHSPIPDQRNALATPQQKPEGIKPMSRLDVPQDGRKADPKQKSDLEKFIGENLINKIGIVITVIGVAIGAKYSIEHELISPLTRIILGYLVGIALIGVGIKLKNKYENYSAVLLSGAMAIMYFITFAAFSFYGLFPRELAFALMLVFTVFTVIAALQYNQQVIALIGLVGAYGVPFLLSDGSGDVRILFLYMAIINAGILIISFKKYWKPVYYTAFLLTWLIFTGWYLSSYYFIDYFATAFIFNATFFATFYVTFMAYKFGKNEPFTGQSVAILLLNAFIFYGLGYGILNNDLVTRPYLGLFTAVNAIIHFVLSMVLYKRSLVDKNLFWLVSGLVLVFITLTIPVQLDGNWVTIIWSTEAVLLFWIGRTKKIPVYEKLAYPLMVLAFFSVLHDWSYSQINYSPNNEKIVFTPIFNIRFLTSAIFMVCFGFIIWLSRKETYAPAWSKDNPLYNILNYAIPAIFIIVAYFSFQIEIANYFSQIISNTSYYFTPEGFEYEEYYWDNDVQNFKSIWLLNYSLLFVAILSFVNIRKLKEEYFGYITLFLNALTITLFLVGGLYVISELRETYLNPALNENFEAGTFNILIRYITYLFVALVLYAVYAYSRQSFIRIPLKLPFAFLLHITILWVASSELIHWLDMAGNGQQYKLALSILWGVYSLILIGLGIWKRKQYLRISAIVLFGVTLLKLFFYDITHLTTIAKTIVFVSLGVLLLIISFLYNKYKANIADEKDA